jgi:hypothetical protein
MSTSRRDHVLEPSYRQLTTVDSAHGIVVDATVVSADVHEGGTLVAQLERIEDLSGRHVGLVTADKGYAYSSNYQALNIWGTTWHGRGYSAATNPQGEGAVEPVQV